MDAREQQISTGNAGPWKTEELLALADEIESSNGLLCMQDKLPKVRQLGIKKTAMVVAALRGIPAQTQPDRREEIAGIFRDYLARATGETLILLQDVLHDVDEALSAVPPAQQTQWKPIETAPKYDGVREATINECAKIADAQVYVNSIYEAEGEMLMAKKIASQIRALSTKVPTQ